MYSKSSLLCTSQAVILTQSSITQTQDFYHSVAVIKKNTMYDVETLADLKGKKACFAKVR